jgi:hypothetical protein
MQAEWAAPRLGRGAQALCSAAPPRPRSPKPKPNMPRESGGDGCAPTTWGTTWARFALRSRRAGTGAHGVGVAARCPVCSAQRTAAACSGGGGGHAQHSAQRTAHSAQRTAQPHGHGHHGRETRCTCTAAQATGANATPPSLFLCSMRRSSQQSRGALHFLNVPHINNRPLKTSLSYAKRKLNRRVGRQRQPFFFALRGVQSPEGEGTEISLL